MTWRTLARTLAVFGALWLAPGASGQNEADDSAESASTFDPSEDSSTNWQICNGYNRYGSNSYYYCTQDYRCNWDGRQCVSAQDPYPRRCENIRDAYQCQRQGCYWDRYYGCSTQPNTPTRCEYIRDAYQCQSSGCYWDRFNGCSSQPSGGGVWECNARDAGYEEHWGGHRAQGYSQAQARNEALRICQKPFGPHDRCVISRCQRVR